MYKAKALKYVITRLPIADEVLEANAKENEVYNSEEVLTAIIDENKDENKADVNSLLTENEELTLQQEPLN